MTELNKVFAYPAKAETLRGTGARALLGSIVCEEFAFMPFELDTTELQQEQSAVVCTDDGEADTIEIERALGAYSDTRIAEGDSVYSARLRMIAAAAIHRLARDFDHQPVNNDVYPPVVAKPLQIGESRRATQADFGLRPTKKRFNKRNKRYK